MQPVLILSAPAEGVVYVNGRFAGEAGGEENLVLPVAPRGRVYLEHRRFGRDLGALTGRLTLRGGEALPESLSDGLYAVMWPGGALEVEMAGEEEDAPPAGRLIQPLNDTVGHALLWRGNGGDEAPEVLWNEGAPRWPASPEDTAMAAAEAVLLGQYDEARGYFTPAALQRGALKRLTDAGADGCARMKYTALPGGAIGLVYRLGERAARVRPMTYRAEASGGAQGPWRIDDVSVEPF